MDCIRVNRFHIFCFNLFLYRADTLPKMQASLATMKNDLKDEEKFKSLYQFTFVFAKSDEQKNLGIYYHHYELFLID